MPWNVVYKLEQICLTLNKKKITTIKLRDLETIIIKNLGVTREATINRYIDILIKLRWIQQIEKKEEEEFEFKITYYKENGDLF